LAPKQSEPTTPQKRRKAQYRAVGLLAGIGVLAIPGIGPLIAAEPVVAALTGVGVGGAVGGAAGALVGLGISEHEAEHYEGRLKKGGILLSVLCDTSEETKQAKEILDRTSAEDSFGHHA
jgi:uncharacterized membrane protein